MTNLTNSLVVVGTIDPEEHFSLSHVSTIYLLTGTLKDNPSINSIFNASSCKMVTLKLDDRSDTDRYDIVESFESLDTQKTGRLEFELAYSLLLGLGYITDYKKKDEFDPTTLKQAARRIESVENENFNEIDFQAGIQLETLLTVVAKVRVFFLQSN